MITLRDISIQNENDGQDFYKKNGSGFLFGDQGHIRDVVLAERQFLCLEDVLSFLSYRDTTIFRPDLDMGNLPVVLVLKPYRNDLGREETVFEELLRVRGVLHYLDLFPHDFHRFLDAGAFLPNGQPHLTRIDHKDEPVVPVIDDTVPTSRTGETFKLRYKLHAVLGQYDLRHLIPS